MLWKKENIPRESGHREGELYRVVTTFGKSFELRYGYYTEKDRQNPLCQPTVIYPDFISEPRYTDGGIPFVTEMQDVCQYFRLAAQGADEGRDNTCYHCAYYQKCEELLGVCRCPQRQAKQETNISNI